MIWIFLKQDNPFGESSKAENDHRIRLVTENLGTL